MPAYKNIWHKRGRDNESLAQDHFVGQGCQVLFQNIKMSFAEVDLLLLAPKKEIWMVEVKSVSEELTWRAPVSKPQLQRLKRAFEGLILASPTFSVRFHLATVNANCEVNVFYDFLSFL